MKVLLTGAAGQLGQALMASRPNGVELIACTRAELDLANSVACRAAVASQRPDWVLNAGAYTAVDKAEREPELAQAVNAGAPAAFAEALAETGGRLLQVSTDFVFNGSQGSPYRPDQPVDPLGVYGATKAAGETATFPCRAGGCYAPAGYTARWAKTFASRCCDSMHSRLLLVNRLAWWPIKWVAPQLLSPWRPPVGGRSERAQNFPTPSPKSSRRSCIGAMPVLRVGTTSPWPLVSWAWRRA